MYPLGKWGSAPSVVSFRFFAPSLEAMLPGVAKEVTCTWGLWFERIVHLIRKVKGTHLYFAGCSLLASYFGAYNAGSCQETRTLVTFFLTFLTMDAPPLSPISHYIFPLCTA